MFPKLKKLLKLGEIPYLLGVARREEPSNSNLLAKCAELEQNLKLSKERLQCIMSIIKSHSNPKLYEFHTTEKGIPVLVSISMEHGRLKVFNINNNPNGNYMLRLDAKYFNKVAEITNIGGGIGLGHGKMAVERFVHHCIGIGLEKVLVRYSPPDKDHEIRYLGFFSKCGFHDTERLGN